LVRTTSCSSCAIHSSCSDDRPLEFVKLPELAEILGKGPGFRLRIKVSSGNEISNKDRVGLEIFMITKDYNNNALVV
jgi:hypothetical protein